MSPWVATTRLFLVATITEQPVPQKRQAALSHFSSATSRSATRFAASAGAGMPAAAAAMAAASSFSIWRRSSFGDVIMALPDSGGFDGVKDQRRGIDVGQRLDRVEQGAEAAGIRRLGHDGELSSRIAAVDLAAGKGGDRGFQLVQTLGARLHDDAGDFATGRRDDALSAEYPAGDQGTAVQFCVGHDACLSLFGGSMRGGRWAGRAG